MSSASMPPTTKKRSAVPPYMMPIFLWSTVVNQLQKPVVAFGRRRSETADPADGQRVDHGRHRRSHRAGMR